MASVGGSKSVYASSDDGSSFDCSPCNYEGVKKEAKLYCLQCQDYLCDSCKSAHQKISATRHHKVVSGSEMPSKQENKSNEGIKGEVQCPCSGKGITIYCKDHNEVMCVDCKTLKHRNCKTSTVDDVCGDLGTTDINETKERMNALKTKLETLHQSRNEDTENLTVQAAECRDKVEEFKAELIQKIEELTNTALDDIANCDREQRQTIEQHINTCGTALNRMEIDYKPFEEAVTARVHPRIFIHNLQLKKTLEQIDNILQDIDKEAGAPGISFEFDETLNMTNVQSLGVVRSTSTIPKETHPVIAETLKMTNVQSLGVVRSTSTIPKESRPVIAETLKMTNVQSLGVVRSSSTTAKETLPVIANLKIKSIEKVDVMFPADQNTPRITGSLFLPNGELILCDYSINSSVKVLNADFTQKEQLKLPSQPWDLCLMENDEIVITQPNTKQLLFMKVVPKLQIGSSTSLDQTCYGVAVHNGLIYVSFGNGEIRILDRTGQQQRNVYSGFSFQTPNYISVMPTGMVYVSERGGDNVRVLKDGKEISNYSSVTVGISSPLGVYIDGAENILVCELNSHNLRIIDAKGNTSKVILSETDGLQRPRTVSVKPNDNTLIVGGYAETIVVCMMATPK